MHFRKYGVPKTWLDLCVKSPVSKDPSKSNMVNAAKLCLNLKDTPFTSFINHCKRNCLTKSLCHRYVKSRNFFLTH